MDNLAGTIKNLLDSKSATKPPNEPINSSTHSVKASLQRNKHKPCANCKAKKRHTNSDGECISTLCAKCYKLKGKKYRKIAKNIDSAMSL